MRDHAVVLRYGQQSPGKGITNIAWAGDTLDTREQRFIVSRANGSLALYDELTSQLVAEPAGNGEIVGLSVITPDSHGSLVQQPTILTCTAKGQLSLTPLATLTSPTPSTSTPTPTTSFSLGDNITRMRLCPLPSAPLIASGGKEQLLRLHDLTTQQCTFKAKNVPHNKLNLRTPIHTTDLAFLHHSSSELVEASAQHAVRLYDVRAGRQPVLDVSVGEHAVTSVVVTGDGMVVIAGDVTGRVVNVDRRKAAVTSAYHGIGGSVRSIALTADDSQLATASLDRHLRLYDRQTRKMTHKVYLKQKLNTTLWSTQIDAQANSVKGEEEGEGEGEGEAGGEEEMWKELEERRKVAARKRRVKEEEKEADADVQVVEKNEAGAAGDGGSKRQRVIAVKQEDEAEDEDEGDDDFAVGELDEDDEDDSEGEEHAEEDEEEDEEEGEEKQEPPPPPPSRKKAQSVRRAK